MTDHLTEARACLSRVDQATAHFSAVSWLTATCEQIIDHLEAQQTEASLRRGLADITAGRTVDLGSFAQPEPDQLGGSDFTGWVARRLSDPEVLAGYLAAHEREVREQVARELQQDDSGHGGGGEAARQNLNAQTGWSAHEWYYPVRAEFRAMARVPALRHPEVESTESPTTKPEKEQP